MKQFYSSIIGFIIGAVILCVLGTFQKMYIGAPLVIKGFAVPFLFGGISGLIIGLWNFKLRKTASKLQKSKDYLEQQVKERTAELSKTNEILKWEIEERKKGEETLRERTAELRKSEERWQFALEGAGDGLWDWDAVTNHVHFSAQWKAMLGYAPQEIGDTLDEWDRRVHPEDKAAVYADLERHIRQETKTYENEHRLMCKDGSYKWILDRGKVIEWTEDGKPRRVIGTHADISERKQAEEALLESEERLSLAVSGTGVGLWDWNMVDDVVHFSPQWKRMLGYEEHEVEDAFTGWKELWHPDDADTIERAVDNYMSGKTSEYEIEHRLRHKNGTWRWILTRGDIVKDSEGKPVRWVGTNLDVTERKQAEKERETLQSQLRRSQKMEAIGTLAGGIAHDFNNILTGILGYGQLAQMKLDPESEVHTDLKEVLQSANRAKSLIQQILAVGRSQEQERQPMQLKYIVKEAIKFLKSTLPSTIEIQEKWDQDIGIIDADPTQMHQVVMNLCTNAGYAMEKDGGILEVSLQNEELRMKNEELGLEPGPYLKLSVSDTGYGIAPEIREKIFDPYFTTKERGEGTGIGLSVVHGIVAQHGGDITVESEPGKGSAFHIYLPLTQAEEDQPQVKEETPLPKGTERVLFIDDEATLARMGKEMLSGLGYDVTAMTDSLEALALFRQDPKQFDLIITDTTMPHMPGDILAHKMMQIRPDIPIIICTGHSKRISPEKAEEMGIKGFLMKPPAMRDLADMVRKALD